MISHSNTRLSCSRNKRVTKLTWYEKSGSGLVDLAMECEDRTHRFTNDNSGSPNEGKVCMDGFSQIQGMEKNGDGIFNVGMDCINDSDDHHQLSNTNHGRWNSRLECSKGVFTGLELRVKSGSEPRIINFKALCKDLPKGKYRCFPISMINIS